ncbi:matrixin family metalloprotease [bacterium]|nr:matrixin family metalloprotease [bacterium]
MKIKITLLLIIFFVSFALPVFSAPARWARPQYIKTYIPQKHRNAKMMKEAFSRWTKASNKNVKFYYVNNPKIAQITVHFVDVVPDHEWSVGLTERRISRRNHTLRSNIYIASESHDGKILSRDEVFTIMLHEIGHALGLSHTRNKLSVMYPVEDVSQEILPSDIKNLYRIYGLKAD